MSGTAREVVLGYIEGVWNRGDLSKLRALTVPGFVYHLNGGPPLDREAFAHFVVQTREAFPDWTVEVDQVAAEPTSVAVRWHGRATHRGPFRGIPATGRTIEVTGINLYHLAQGKITSEWEQMDSLGLLQQLGALAG